MPAKPAGRECRACNGARTAASASDPPSRGFCILSDDAGRRIWGIRAVTEAHDAFASESPRPGRTPTPESCAERLPSPGPQSVSGRRRVDPNCLPIDCHLVGAVPGPGRQESNNTLFLNDLMWRSGKDSNPRPADWKFRSVIPATRSGWCQPTLSRSKSDTASNSPRADMLGFLVLPPRRPIVWVIFLNEATRPSKVTSCVRQRAAGVNQDWNPVRGRGLRWNSGREELPRLEGGRTHGVRLPAQ